MSANSLTVDLMLLNDERILSIHKWMFQQKRNDTATYLFKMAIFENLFGLVERVLLKEFTSACFSKETFSPSTELEHNIQWHRDYYISKYRELIPLYTLDAERIIREFLDMECRHLQQWYNCIKKSLPNFCKKTLPNLVNDDNEIIADVIECLYQNGNELLIRLGHGCINLLEFHV